MIDCTLLILLDEIRGKLLRVLEGVDERQARFAPPGLHNTILWHAGHCYIVTEWLIAGALAIPPQAAAGWFEMFSWESEPARISPDRWPRLADVVAALKEQREVHAKRIAAASASQLDAPAGQGRTMRGQIIHALHDEACHTGEIWLLRKLQQENA